jgi:hypothetical protein
MTGSSPGTLGTVLTDAVTRGGALPAGTTLHYEIARWSYRRPLQYTIRDDAGVIVGDVVTRDHTSSTAVIHLGPYRQALLTLHDDHGCTVVTTTAGHTIAWFEYRRFRSQVPMHTSAGHVASIRANHSARITIRTVSGVDLAVIDVMRSGLSRAAHQCRLFVQAETAAVPAAALLTAIPAFNTTARRRRSQTHM